MDPMKSMGFFNFFDGSRWIYRNQYIVKTVSSETENVKKNIKKWHGLWTAYLMGSPRVLRKGGKGHVGRTRSCGSTPCSLETVETPGPSTTLSYSRPMNLKIPPFTVLSCVTSMMIFLPSSTQYYCSSFCLLCLKETPWTGFCPVKVDT